MKGIVEVDGFFIGAWRIDAGRAVVSGLSLLTGAKVLLMAYCQRLSGPELAEAMWRDDGERDVESRKAEPAKTAGRLGGTGELKGQAEPSARTKLVGQQIFAISACGRDPLHLYCR